MLPYNRSNAIKTIIATIIISGISLVYGLSAITKESGRDTVSITVVQGNVPQHFKWKPEFRIPNFEKYVRLSKEALNSSNTSLIVWTESAVQGILKYDSYLLEAVLTLARQTQTHLLIGNTQYQKFSSGGSEKKLEKKRFDTASLISPRGRIEEEYNRIILFPFSQYLPWKDFFPWP
jgi:apolipoprotein N-acyltransferase